jgi:hypothetical protein
MVKPKPILEFADLKNALSVLRKCYTYLSYKTLETCGFLKTDGNNVNYVDCDKTANTNESSKKQVHRCFKTRALPH